jgi:hypothetical protein
VTEQDGKIEKKFPKRAPHTVPEHPGLFFSRAATEHSTILKYTSQ